MQLPGNADATSTCGSRVWDLRSERSEDTWRILLHLAKFTIRLTDYIEYSRSSKQMADTRYIAMLNSNAD